MLEFSIISFLGLITSVWTEMALTLISSTCPSSLMMVPIGAILVRLDEA